MEGKFKDLAGIGKENKIILDKKRLEHMIEVTEELSKKQLRVLPTWLLGEDIHSTIYDPLYQMMSGCDFCANDIKSLIDVYSKKERYNWYNQRVLGSITGAFLSLLTERNRKNNTKTGLELDGKNIYFNNLFDLVKDADSLIFRDLALEHPGEAMGSFGGNIETLAFINNRTRLLGQHSAVFGGKIKNLIFYGNSCSQLGVNTSCNGGEIDLLMAVNNDADLYFGKLAEKNGKIKNLLLVMDERVLEYRLDEKFICNVDKLIAKRIIRTGGQRTIIDYTPPIFYPFENRKMMEKLEETRSFSDKIAGISLQIDPYDTKQMMGKVDQIRDEFARIK